MFLECWIYIFKKRCKIIAAVNLILKLKKRWITTWRILWYKLEFPKFYIINMIRWSVEQDVQKQMFILNVDNKCTVYLYLYNLNDF